MSLVPPCFVKAVGGPERATVVSLATSKDGYIIYGIFGCCAVFTHYSTWGLEANVGHWRGLFGTFETREQCLLQGAHHDLSWCRSLTLTQQKKRWMGSNHLGIAATGFCSNLSAFPTLQYFSRLSGKDTKKASMILSAKVSTSKFPMTDFIRIWLCDFSWNICFQQFILCNIIPPCVSGRQR